MIVKRVGPFSCAKINCLVSASIGLIIGFFWSAGALFIGSLMGEMGGQEGRFAALFGIGAIIFMPLFYGMVGFIGGLIAAWLYNLFAAWVGGIEIEFEQPPGPPPAQNM